MKPVPDEVNRQASQLRRSILALMPEVREHRDKRMNGKTIDERERAAAAYALVANRIIEALLKLYDMGPTKIFPDGMSGNGRSH